MIVIPVGGMGREKPNTDVEKSSILFWTNIVQNLHGSCYQRRRLWPIYERYLNGLNRLWSTRKNPNAYLCSFGLCSINLVNGLLTLKLLLQRF